MQGFDDLFSSSIVLVTGKGGVGKTTTAATLGLAGVASGRRTLLVEVEGRQSFPRLFDTSPWDYQEREFRPGLWGTAIDAADAVYEYLEMYYGIRRVQWLMEKSNAIDFVTASAPGLRDLLYVGKIYEIEKRRRSDGRRLYDLIVVDAPPTGRIVPFLGAPEAVTEIVRIGPIKRQAAQIGEMLTNPRRTTAVLVSLLEEMPVQEAIDGVGKLEAAGLTCGPIIVNQAISPRVDRGDHEQLQRDGVTGLRSRAKEAGAPLSAELAELVLRLSDVHRNRLELQADMRARLSVQTSLPMLELPRLPVATFDDDALKVLADVLAVQIGERGPRAGDAPGWSPQGRISIHAGQP